MPCLDLSTEMLSCFFSEMDKTDLVSNDEWWCVCVTQDNDAQHATGLPPHYLCGISFSSYLAAVPIKFLLSFQGDENEVAFKQKKNSKKFLLKKN